MANFVSKRLQVFVSSTFEDLKAERQAAVQAILKAGHIPAGMELFVSGDQSQMDTIKEWIDDSDVFMLILGSRYGSIEPTTGRSYTELEYDYAANASKPLFSCVIKEEAIIPRIQRDAVNLESKSQKELSSFRQRVTSKMVEFWEDEKDIKLNVFNSLSEIARRKELLGWVRANHAIDLPSLANEVARLSKENADLRAKGSHTLYCGLSFEGLVELLEARNLTSVLLTIRDDLKVSAGKSPRGVAFALTKALGGDNENRRCECYELVTIGLIDFVQDPPSGMGSPTERVVLTDDCKRFLNRFDFEFAQKTHGD